MYSKEIIDRIKNAKMVAIYCAGKVAEQVAFCLNSMPYNIKIDYFIVTSKANEPMYYCGSPVISVVEASKLMYKDDLIIIACMERILPEISNTLNAFSFSNILPLTFEDDKWADLRANYFCNRFAGTKRPFIMIDDLRGMSEEYTYETPKKITVFSAQSAADKKILDDKGENILESKPIYAGSCVATKNVHIIRDDDGINISDRNSRFCEVTALYWVWKNDTSSYKGLCHYRRKYILDERARRVLSLGIADVILTIPVINLPNVRAQFAYDHDEKDWEIMKEAVRLLQPDYYKDFIALESGNYYYGYNMFIAKREIFDDYCSFLFPILFYCDDKIDKGKTRHIGFLAERLLGVYMFHHWEEYKIFHARRHFFEMQIP